MKTATPDVRILCHELEMLSGRLYMTDLTFASKLSGYDDQKSQYPATALVPNPYAIRKCSDDEQAQYIHPIGDTLRLKSDVVMYLDEYADTFWDDNLANMAGWSRIGSAEALPGELTTTHNVDIPAGRPTKEGLHLDVEETFGHRLGVCIQGTRWLLVGTHSAKALLGEKSEWSTSAVRELFSTEPEHLGSLACLMVPFYSDELYDAYTSHVLHDGSTWLNRKSEGSTPASIYFFGLQA